MGYGYTMKCPKCHYVFSNNLGIGFRFLTVNMEITEKAKSGKMGKTLKRFFDENPDGSIETARVTLCCERCGNLSGGLDLTMYAPPDIKRNYPHKCGKCRGKMRIVDEEEQLLCPACKIPLEEISSIMWD